MTTQVRKPLEEYFTEILDRIEFKVRVNERTGQVFFFARVPSSSSDDTYMVGLDENDAAKWCDCGDHCYRHIECKHMQAVNLKKRIADAKAYAAVNIAISEFYAVRGPGATANLAALKIDDAPLNGSRASVAPSPKASSIEKGLARLGFLK